MIISSFQLVDFYSSFFSFKAYGNVSADFYSMKWTWNSVKSWIIACHILQAVQEYYQLRVKTEKPRCLDNQVAIAPHSGAAQNPEGFGDSSVVVVTESDLDGYDGSNKSGIVGNDIWAELSWVYKIHYSGQAALAKISCLWLRYHAPNQGAAAEKLGRENCLVDSNQMGPVGVDIPIYLLTAVVECAEKID